MSIKKQLQKFYAKQGLTGEHRRCAMKHDRRLIRKGIAADQVAGHSYGWPTQVPDCLFNAFNWSAQGTIPGIKDVGLYWCVRDMSI